MFGSYAYAASLPCGKQAQDEHRENDIEAKSFVCVPASALVSKLLDRSETRTNPKAIAAVQKEGRALVDAETWLEDTVIERSELIERSKSDGNIIHMGDLMSICSVKHAEGPEHAQVYKGRVCFRGDNVRDQDGALAIFQELSAQPTTIHTANSNIAYGSIPGHSCETADAIRAYIQSELHSQHATWVRIPKELWPQEWHARGYRAPMCLLKKALYGHPESGGHWERHLTNAVVHIGGEAVPNHPSSFWFPKLRLLLTVYVDDLLLSGPTGAHQQVWEALQRYPIAIDPPEPLHRFLGRVHDRTDA